MSPACGRPPRKTERSFSRNRPFALQRPPSQRSCHRDSLTYVGKKVTLNKFAFLCRFLSIGESLQKKDLQNRNKARVSFFFFFFYKLIYLFIHFWLCWVFAPVLGPSPVAASGGHSSSRCAGPPPPRPLPLRSTGSKRTGPAAVAHGPSRSAARGILPDQGPNPRPPHRQADSQPLRHQGSPKQGFLK